jgi:hypothetical protein
MDVSTRNITDGFRFWFYNYEGTSMAFDVTSYGDFPLSQSAEVVVERPQVNGSYTNLANFQTLYVTAQQSRNRATARSAWITSRRT